MTFTITLENPTSMEQGQNEHWPGPYFKPWYGAESLKWNYRNSKPYPECFYGLHRDEIFFWKPLIFSFRNHIEQENCSLFVWILKKKHILQSNQINFAIEEVFQKSLLLSIRYEDDHSVFISWSWRKTTNKKLSTHNSYHFTHFLSILRDLRCVTHKVAAQWPTELCKTQSGKTNPLVAQKLVKSPRLGLMVWSRQ